MITAEHVSDRLVRFTVGDASIEAEPRASKRLSAFAAANGVEIDELLSALQAPFRPTGDVALDEQLRGCVIPPREGEPASGYRDLMPEVVPAAEPFSVRARGRRETAAGAKTVRAPSPLAALLRGCEFGDLVEWRGRRRLAVLDLDWHGGDVPGEHVRRGIAVAVRPHPAAWWISPRGAHLVYEELGGFRADELAAAGAVSALAAGASEVEVLSRTARPPGEVVAGAGDTAALSLWRAREVTAENEAAVLAWLSERGLSYGRHAHELCPWNPGPNSSGGTPVVVSESGVVCFSCAGRHASLPALAGGFTESRLLIAARAAVHFDHARHLIAAECPELPEPLRRPAWSCFLRLTLGADDPRVPRCMVTHYVVRGAGGVWLDALTFEPISPQVGPEVTRRLPCVLWINEDGEAKLDPERHDLLRTNQRLRGLDEIIPVRGIPLWSRTGREYAETDRVRATAPFGPRPHWPDAAPDPVVIDDFFRERFPGIDVSYLRLLIAARAHAESGVGLVPMIATTGPTGSGKTMTVHLAAHVVGDRVEAILHHEPERLHMAIGDASMRSSYLLLDEYGKTGVPDQLVAALLGLSREFSYRRLYKGQVTVPLNCTLVLTNTEFPESMRASAQLGRRVVLVELTTRGRDWQETCGTGDIRAWRGDSECAAMADAMLRLAVEHCGARFVDTARALGFGTLEQNQTEVRGGSDVAESLVRDLFAAIEQAEDSARPLAGPGWRQITRDGDAAADLLWAQLCDDPMTRDGFGASRAVSELDLQRVLGTRVPVLLRIRGPHGRRLALRFETREGVYNECIE